jgi:nucleotide-binding universal stress UspA family protein
MKVLIAVDGSSGSFAAVDQLGCVLSAERDQIALYCTPPAVQVRSSSTDPQLLARARTALGGAIFAEARKRLPPPLAAKTEQIEGTQDARTGIVAAADQWNADLVAVGARGLNPLKRLLLGSVSRSVVHRSTRPVWVAREAAVPTKCPLNVLLACETAELGRPTGELLNRFTWPAESKFTALSVLPSIFAGQVPDWLEKQARSPDVEAMVQAWAREHDADVAAGRERIEKLVASLGPPLGTARSLVVEGEPAREILNTAQKEQTHVLAVGSQHRHSMATMILGSTVEAVLNHAPCSVLIAPHRVKP